MGTVWSEMVFGAFLGAILGYLAQWWFEAWRHVRNRNALGSTLLTEVHQTGDPLKGLGDVGFVHQCHFPTLDVLLSSNAVDPAIEDDLLTHMVFLQSVVRRFNEAADIYNQARLSQLPESQITLYWNQLCGTSWDLNDALEEMKRIGERLGPLLELIDDRISIEERYSRRAERPTIRRLRSRVRLLRRMVKLKGQ